MSELKPLTNMRNVDTNYQNNTSDPSQHNQISPSIHTNHDMASSKAQVNVEYTSE
jgi:hypothetical protein